MEGQENIDIQSKKITDEIKKKSLEDIGILDKYPDYISKLKGINIQTLGDLIYADTNKVREVINADGYSSYYFLRSLLMENNFLFEDDRIAFEKQGISSDLALIPVKELDLPPSTKNLLVRRYGVLFFGDLLTLDYNAILKFKMLPEDRLIELKKYLHSLGFSLPNEREFLKEKLERYRKNGIVPVGDELNLDGGISTILYKSNIFTVEDLINFGPLVFRLVGMGKIRNDRLKEAMIRKNISFNKTSQIQTDVVSNILPSEKIIQQLRTEYMSIDDRIKEKESCMTQLEVLNNTKKVLVSRENQLDEEINKLSQKLKVLNMTNGGTNYGRRSN